MIPEKKLHEIHIKHGITALNVFEKYPRIGGGEVRAKNLELLQEELNVSCCRIFFSFFFFFFFVD